MHSPLLLVPYGSQRGHPSVRPHPGGSPPAPSWRLIHNPANAPSLFCLHSPPRPRSLATTPRSIPSPLPPPSFESSSRMISSSPPPPRTLRRISATVGTNLMTDSRNGI